MNNIDTKMSIPRPYSFFMNSSKKDLPLKLHDRKPFAGLKGTAICVPKKNIEGGATQFCLMTYRPHEHTVTIDIFTNIQNTKLFWLVVLTILKHISQWEGLSPLYGNRKNVPNHQPESYWTYKPEVFP